MLIIGLTGGIGSGKTTVAEIFASLGIEIIDADAIAKTSVAPDQPAFKTIVDHFGQEILISPKSLDRSKLKKIIFNDPKERLWLEQLLHPLIIKEIQHKISTIHSPYVIIVVPLLFESQTRLAVDRILVVDSPPGLQIERIQARDKLSPDFIQKILATQFSREARLKQANDVIKNDKNVENIVKQVKKLHKTYLKLTKHRDSI